MVRASSVLLLLLGGACGPPGREDELLLTLKWFDGQCPGGRVPKDGSKPPQVITSVEDCPTAAQLEACRFFGETYTYELRGIREDPSLGVVCVYRQFTR